jgi:hypothetical protein
MLSKFVYVYQLSARPVFFEVKFSHVRVINTGMSYQCTTCRNPGSAIVSAGSLNTKSARS